MEDTPKLYNDPILSKKRKGSIDDPYQLYNETQVIYNGKAQLTEVPNREMRIEVSGDGKLWKEIEDGELQDDYFKVDYLNGVVFFNASNEGKSLQFKYSGEGAYYFPGSRIWTKRDGNEVTETLDSLTERARKATEESEKATEESKEITKWTRAATSDYENVVENTRKIYLPMVYTYKDLLDTYPNPQIGWTVTIRETGIEYRWDGFDWINISISDKFDGYNIVSSYVEPYNIRTVWLRTNTSPSKKRVKPSKDAPETNLIWIRKE
ncbi:hypothetical protein CHCC20491_1787 [Bacillus paralicheniformis]|uniref:hypothetical protein n=1 Tax=Bacillus paralicheniformis TaxID=1648923 RepID=UPI0011A3CEDB|nr:hypothetical protein [Bacillus paralicheniformis]TWN93136.1 hypothetical protein CHCC20491_1787 [Bacillus paralicheniformis]